MNRNAAATIPGAVPFTLVVPAKTAILTACPTPPKIIKLRRPNRSIVNTAIKLARKYSVPFAAARMRLMKGERPMYCS
jgi:hypothetical protein